MFMKRIEGGVCAAKGFKATGLEVGSKIIILEKRIWR